MVNTNWKTRRALMISLIFGASLLSTFFFSTSLFGATAETPPTLDETLIQCSNTIGTPPPTSPPITELFMAYHFDAIQQDSTAVHNDVVSAGVSWMEGLIQGEPKIMSAGGNGNKALMLNLDIEGNPDGNDDFLQGNYSHKLTFQQGILVTTRICLVNAFHKGTYLIASQVTNSNGGTNHWRLAIDQISNEGYNLTFTAWFDDGTSYLVKYPIPGSIEDKWVDVGAAYNPVTGRLSLYWNNQQVRASSIGKNKRIRVGTDPIRVGMGEDSNPTAAFEGGVDNVRIWGDRPPCYSLTTIPAPNFTGSIFVTPGSGQTPFCADLRSYAPGERVGLIATANTTYNYLFYQWLGDLNFLPGSEDQKYDISIVIDQSTTATAHFLSPAEAPKLRRFPVNGPHNTSIDEATCSGGTCTFACGSGAVARSNDVCHEGAQDIFADPGTNVIAAQMGRVQFGCNAEGGNWATITEGDFTHHYTHLDRVCFQDASGNLVTNLCPNYIPQAEINCLGNGFRNGSTVSVGHLIGTVGNSGSAISTTAHLHYQIQERGVGFYCSNMDPFPFLYSLEATSCDGISPPPVTPTPSSTPAPTATPTVTPVPGDPALWTELPLAISPLQYPTQANSNVTILSGNSFLAEFNSGAGSDFWMGGGVMSTAREVPVGIIFYWDGVTDTVGKRMCLEGGNPPNIDAQPCAWGNTSDQFSDGLYCVADYAGPWTPNEICQQMAGINSLGAWGWQSDLVRGLGWEQLAEDFTFTVSGILFIYYSVPITPTPTATPICNPCNTSELSSTPVPPLEVNALRP